MPTVTVPLPSRRELCQFTLRPVTNTVGDFTKMLKTEDQGVDRVIVSSSEGVRIASSNTIESLMEEDFRLTVNDRIFTVKVPPHKKLTKVRDLNKKKKKNARSISLFFAVNVINDLKSSDS